jgi:predicted phosphodiesterase
MRSQSGITRRELLAATASLTTASLATALATPPLRGADDQSSPVAFFLVGDTHYLAEKEQPTKLDERSAAVCSRLVETLNALPGTAIPEKAGGGAVRAPRGVIHAGDLIDSGDKNGRVYERMQQAEWDAFAADYGLTGQDGRLKFPVYEVHGNHDGPGGNGLVIDGITERNKRRPGLTQVSANGLHYSWDWGPVHFVNLGIVVGRDRRVAQRRRYDPLDSLDFLVADLKEHAAGSGRPVVVTHHVDVVRYSGPCDREDPANLGKEWHPCDVRAYHAAIRNYNVAAVLYGHTHARHVLSWDGTAARAAEGLPLFNVDNSSHFHGERQAVFYFEITPRETLVRECATKDAWRTHEWTPQFWRRPLAR